MKRVLLIIAGFISIGLGIIGIFIPLLPTTAFLLLAVWLFSKSSPRWRAWLLDHPYLGRHIRNYTLHRGITRKAKIRTLLTLWITLAVSASLTYQRWYIPVILLFVGVGVTWHISVLRTLTEESLKIDPQDYVDSGVDRNNVA